MEKNKKRLVSSNRKKGSIGDKFKCRGTSQRCKNDYKMNDVADLENSIEDGSYEEARSHRNLEKRLGLCAENEDEVIKALVEAHEDKEDEFKQGRCRRKKECNLEA